MRISFRRAIIGCYVVVCVCLSLLNYHYSAYYFLTGSQSADEDAAAGVEIFSPSDEPIPSAVFAAAVAAERGKSPVPITKPPVELRPKPTITPVDELWPPAEHLGAREGRNSDRILAQMNYAVEPAENKTFFVYMPHGYGSWNVKGGGTEFAGCPASNCELTDQGQLAGSADAVIFRNNVHELPGIRRDGQQIWIFYTLESPMNTPDLTAFAGKINWTATYRRHSDLVAPYEKFVTFDEVERFYPNLRRRIEGTKIARRKSNYALGKKLKVAWFVSNCMTSNQRLAVANELKKYIGVDIYGVCGPKKCARFNSQCFDLLNSQYKFYLAFENSNCRDYATEKFFVNGLSNDVLPIVMGGSREDYDALAPPQSYIHVEDFRTIRELGMHLRYLDRNATAYNEYFAWKGTGQFINTKFWCRLCTMLNVAAQARHRKVYADVNNWWRGDQTCRSERWDGQPPVPDDVEGKNAAPTTLEERPQGGR